MNNIYKITLFITLALSTVVNAQAPSPDLSKEKVLYCVPYAHLDTQWRWDYPTTINEFIKNTLDDNFVLFDKYPKYQFTFTGAIRYAMMKEYYPDKFQRLKGYVNQGKWHVGGSSAEEGDVNVPSPESVIRQVLYGNHWFKKELGVQSVDYMLPDCFGFQASLPSIWAHCGLRGFSTQKLSWGSAVGIPFPVGMWIGPDGKGVICAFDPGSYGGGVDGRLDIDPYWVGRVNQNGEKYGIFADYHYFGTGDIGGAPRDNDVDMASKSMDNPDGQIKVVMAASDQMFRDITDSQATRLPTYKGDLLLTQHSAGSITSQAYMKRWNRKNELLADSAERASVAASWLGAQDYPIDRLNIAWTRVLGSQFHDILPGTSIPKAYEYSWNDEIIASNIFSRVLERSAGAVIRSMDTSTKGTPVVVYNPLAIDRTDVVEATVQFPGKAPQYVSVFDSKGMQVPSSISERKGNSAKIIFPAKVKSVGYAVYDVRPSQSAYSTPTGLKISSKTIENEYYKVSIDKNGDVCSIIDKLASKELLSGPAQLQFLYENPSDYPAWNMDWADRQKPPVEVVSGPAKVRIVENSPVRVALEITRKARNSIFVQQIRLSTGDAGKRVEFKTFIDWRSMECSLKASFPLTVSNPMATYNLGLATIERSTNDPKKYEVPSREWFDLTSSDGKYGVSVLEDCKFGSDKPTDNTLRLTLLYTPGVRGGFQDEYSQDWGRHDMLYALYGHSGSWQDGASEWQGRSINQPLVAFQSDKHTGTLGNEFSILSVSTPQVDVRAFKRAEDTDLFIVRIQELFGKSASGVKLTFPSQVADAYEVNGQESRIEDADIVDGKLFTDMSPYAIRSFAVKLKSPSNLSLAIASRPVSLEYNEDVISTDNNRTDGKLDINGQSIPAEELPATINCEGISFTLGSKSDGQKNALACRGQKIELLSGEYNSVYLLVASIKRTDAKFITGKSATNLTIPSWTGFIGQYDNRVWDSSGKQVIDITPGYIQRDPVAWFCTHRHSPAGNDAYQFSYLFIKRIPVSPRTKTLTLPDDPQIKLMAVSVATENSDIRPAQPLYDDFSNRGAIDLRVETGIIDLTKGLKPITDVTIDRKESFDSLIIGAPSKNDYADASSDNGVEVIFDDAGGRLAPHVRAGAVGNKLPRLNDGDYARMNDDVNRCVWYDHEGRFQMDLKKSINIDRINTYSWHRSNRAPQRFSLWVSNAEIAPSMLFTNPKKSGWTFLTKVDTWPLGSGAIQGSSVTGKNKPLGPYRHLLWISEDVVEGTFFTEIDVYEALTKPRK